MGLNQKDFAYFYDGPTREYIDQAASLFDDLAKRGLIALPDLLSLAALMNPETNAVPLLYRHAASLVDSLSPIVSQPCVETMRIVTRSFLEAKCSLEFMIGDGAMVSRAVAYQTKELMERIKAYEKLDTTTQSGKQFRVTWQKDDLLEGVPFPASDTKDEISNLASQLNREPYASAHAKFRSDPRAAWYSLDGGPRSFQGLCEHLGYHIYYEYCYRQWSSFVHATAAYHDSYFSEGSAGNMHALRALAGFKETMDFAVPMIVGFYFVFFKALLPKHLSRFAVFYKNQFRDKWNEVLETDVSLV